MQTLIFNTTEKTVELFDSLDLANANRLLRYVNVPTVRPKEGFYEVVQKDTLDEVKVYPVARLPISATIMLIER